MKRVVVLLLPALALLSACGSTHYCMVEQDYQKTKIVPELQPTADLQLPESAGALRLPPPPANSTPFGVEDKDGNGVCLDQPPRMTTPPKPEKSVTEKKVSSAS